MFTHIFKEIPLDQIERDPNQPRHDLHIYDQHGAWLQESIQKLGVLVALAVLRLDDGRYMVIDGHRRLICAQRLGLVTMPCHVYNGLSEADAWRLRFDLQDNWEPPAGFRSRREERKDGFLRYLLGLLPLAKHSKTDLGDI